MEIERLAVEANIISRIEIIPSFSIQIIAPIRGTLTINKEYSVDDIISHVKLESTGSVEHRIGCTIRTNKLEYRKDIPAYMKLEMFKGIYDPILLGHIRYNKEDIIEDNNITPIVDIETGIRSNEIIGSISLVEYISENNEILGHGYIEREETLIDPEEESEYNVNPIVDIEKNIRSNEIIGNLKYIRINTIDPESETGTSNEFRGRVIIDKIETLIDPEEESEYNVNPIVDMNTKIRSNEILGHGYIEREETLIDPEEESEYNVNPIVDIETGIRSNEIIGSITLERDNSITDIPAYMKLEMFKGIYDPILLGHIRYNKENIIEDNNITPIVDIEKNIRSNEIIGYIKSYKYIDNTELIGYLTIEETNIMEDYDITPTIDIETGIRSNEILGDVTVESMTVEEYKQEIDPYVMHYTQHNEILGHGYIDKNVLIHTIVEGYSNIEREDNIYDLEGSILYERDQRILDLYAKCKLEITGNIEENNEIQCHLTFESKGIETDSAVIVGHAKIVQYYKSIDIPCIISTKNIKYIYSLFASIEVPPERTIIIPCRIEVDDTNVFKSTILKGSLTIAPRDKIEEDILIGNATYTPGSCIDIIGHGYIDSIYTRREIECRIDVIVSEEILIPCTIDVAEHRPRPKPILRPTYYYPISRELEPVLEKDSKEIHITINENNISNSLAIQHLKKIEKDNSNIPKGKIVIAVSPTWSYEPYVFKNSLITFLDRYYRKADIAIVFGGNKRSDYDIVNLCLNYRISRDNLCCVIPEYEARDKQFFVRKFIETMVEFKKEEYPNILRVFMFINQPNWYYNDPLAPLATYCKTNNISAVAISPGGEYCEICEIDKVIDELNNGIEWERQHKNHKTHYVNIRLEDENDRLVY